MKELKKGVMEVISDVFGTHPKYKLTKIKKECMGSTLYRIRALRQFETQFGIVRKNQYGGFVQSEKNLEHTGRCWIYDDAMALGESIVKDDAVLKDGAWITNRAWAFGNSVISEGGSLWGDSYSRDHAHVHGHAMLNGSAGAVSDADISGDVKICFGKVQSIVTRNEDFIYINGIDWMRGGEFSFHFKTMEVGYETSHEHIDKFEKDMIEWEAKSKNYKHPFNAKECIMWMKFMRELAKQRGYVNEPELPKTHTV